MSKQTTTERQLTPSQPPAPNLVALEDLATKYSLAAIDSKGRFERALLLAEGLQALRQAVAPIMPRIMPLMDSQLGFLTDRKDRGGYPTEVVQECLIEAVLRGVYPVGNQFNIISGRCYITLNGFRHLLKEMLGLTDLRIEQGVPRMSQGGAVVPVKASWKVNGKADTLTRDIPVRLNAGMGADGAIGKATRKMLASVYAQVTGSELTEGEVGEKEAVLLEGGTRTQQVLDKLAPPSNGSTPISNGTIQNIRLAGQRLGLAESGYEDLLPEGVRDVRLLSEEQGMAIAADLERRWAERQPVHEQTEAGATDEAN